MGGSHIAIKRHPFAHDIGIDVVAHRDVGDGGAWFQAFLNDLCFEGLW
jgi:hypothetical protein